MRPAVSIYPHLPACTKGGGDAMRTEAGLRGEIKHNEPMARHVSWRAGGAVDRAYFPADLADLVEFLQTLPAAEMLYFVGLGSNLLVRDGGLRGTVVFTHRALQQLRLAGDEVYAEAGVASPKVARFTALHDLAGAEFLVGIPGTVGGALAMNAGCYGGETWDIVASVTTIDRAGTLHEYTPANFDFGYRHVRLKVQGEHCEEEWFVAATFRLHAGNKDISRNKIKDLLSSRIASQPLGQPNAGSVFRNPRGDYAARLIEACGLKGHAVGGAVISPKHANFIVNTGTASAADIETLIDTAQSAVKREFGIALECEVRIVGEVK
jgi:UDP-N-acetylmuramate dehydrogenase